MILSVLSCILSVNLLIIFVDKMLFCIPPNNPLPGDWSNMGVSFSWTKVVKK